MTTLPIITFLSDYGLADDFVGVCHGVMAGICPSAVVIDVSHGVPRGDVRAGALMLSGALPYLPVGVHLAVVDPGVGSERRAIALATADGRRLVGPDNGLLWPAAERAGGVLEAVDIGRSPVALQPISATFHGRDVFAPVAARLALGAALVDVGTAVDAARLVALDLPRARLEDGVLVAHAVYLDAFGNVQLDADEVALVLGQTVDVATVDGVSARAHYGRTFADVAAGELLVYEDSDRRLALAVNQGSAAERLGLAVGDEVRISWP